MGTHNFFYGTRLTLRFGKPTQVIRNQVAILASRALHQHNAFGI